MPEAHAAAGLGDRLADIGGAVVAHHPPVIDSLAFDPGDYTVEKAEHRWLLLIRQYLHVVEAGGVNHGDTHLIVPDTIGVPLLPFAGDR